MRPPREAKSSSLPGRRRGFSSVMATLYVALFSGLAVAYTAMTGLNAEITGNTRGEQIALAAAESGLSVMRHQIGRLAVRSGATAEELFEALGEHLRDTFDGTLNLSGGRVSVGDDQILVPPIAIDPDCPGATFSVRILQDGDGFPVEVTGRFNGVSRTVRLTFVENAGPSNRSIMNHGIISRGSININGSAVLTSNVPGGSSVMSLDGSALTPIRVNGSGRYDGDFYMVKEGVTASSVFNGAHQFLNPETGVYESNLDDHVHSGIPEPAWPELDTERFKSKVLALPHTAITSSTNLNGTNNFGNLYVQASANPRFNGTTTITGLVYVEWPNDIRFNGALNITGMIVCEQPPFEPGVDDSPTNSMLFNGAVNSSGVENLPDTPQYAGLHDEIGTFLLAPDYDVTFNGAQGTINGTIYTSGLRLNGATSGTVRGSIMVDRRRTLLKNGAVTLHFEVIEEYKDAAGLVFESHVMLVPLAESYQEA